MYKMADLGSLAYIAEELCRLGYRKVTKYMHDNAAELLQEVKE